MSVKRSMLVCLIESFVESTGELLRKVSKQWNWMKLNPNATLRRTVDNDTMWNKWFLVLGYHASSMTISCLFDQCVIWGQPLITSSTEVAPQLNIVRDITRGWPYGTTNLQWKFYHTIHALHIRDYSIVRGHQSSCLHALRCWILIRSSTYWPHYLLIIGIRCPGVFRCQPILWARCRYRITYKAVNAILVVKIRWSNSKLKVLFNLLFGMFMVSILLKNL